MARRHGGTASQMRVDAPKGWGWLAASTSWLEAWFDRSRSKKHFEDYAPFYIFGFIVLCFGVVLLSELLR